MNSNNGNNTETLLAIWSFGLPRQSRQLENIAAEIEQKEHADKGTVRASTFYFRQKIGNKDYDGLTLLKDFQYAVKKDLEILARYPFAGGANLLPATLVTQFLDRKSLAEEQMQEVWKQWSENDYNDWALTAPQRMGSLFDEKDFPSLEESLRRFKCDIQVFPLPVGEQWQRFKTISPSLAQQMEDSNNADIAKAVGEAKLQTVKDIFAPIQKIIEVCSKDKPKFHETLIGNLTTILSVAPSYAGNDQEMLDFINATKETLGTITVDMLRTDPDLKIAVAKNAQDLLAKFGQLGNRKFA